MCVCVFPCVFLCDNSKRNLFRKMKFKYFVVYETSLILGVDSLLQGHQEIDKYRPILLNIMII